MRYYPSATPYIYQEQPTIWDLHCQSKKLSWHRKSQEKIHAINIYRDLDMAFEDFVHDKDLQFKNWKTPRRRKNVFLPIYYGTGIERPSYNYNYEKYYKLLESLEKQKTPPTKSNPPAKKKVKRERKKIKTK